MGVVCWDECELIRQMQTEMRASGRGKASKRLTPHAANPTGQEQEQDEQEQNKDENRNCGRGKASTLLTPHTADRNRIGTGTGVGTGEYEQR